MKLTKCEKKHFYDADKYDKCPHCGGANLTPARDNPKSHKPGGGGFSPASGSSNTLTSQTSHLGGQLMDKNTASFIEEFSHPKPAQASKPPVAPKPNPPVIPITPYKSAAPVNKGVSGEDEETVMERTPLPVSPTSHTGTPSTNLPQKVDEKPPERSVQSQLKSIVSHGNTDDQRTVAFYDVENSHPVVGWLVGVKGVYLGESFNLKAGQNFVGRALNMDVPLTKDTSVSRNKHAIVIYDPKNKKFFVQPGESSGLTYLNGELLLIPTPIQEYEKIIVGNSELVFVPFCGDKFSWEDHV